MNLDMLKVGGKQVGDFLMKNSPTILTGLGVGGVLTTVVMAVTTTPKAMTMIVAKQDMYDKDAKTTGMMPYELSKIDIVKLTWKCYVPTALMGVTTIGCIIMANTINLRRNAALAGLYSLSEAALQEYQKKVVETLGEKKEEKLREEITQDKLTNDPVENKTVVITGRGKTLCYDRLSGRYFESDIDVILKAQNQFNYKMINGDFMTLNEWYDLLGLEHTELGKNLGWTVDYGMLEISLDSKLATNNQPCAVINYVLGPKAM